jgi:Uma2 family endonuclease
MSTPALSPARPLPRPSSVTGQSAPGVVSSLAAWVPSDLYRITVDEYERIGGMLDDPDKVELIDGYLVRKMSKNPPHVATVKRAYKTLDALLPAGWTWQKEDPVRIPEFNEPEPDVAILKGSDNEYTARIPGPSDVALAIEVAESTLERDRGRKHLAYAYGGIPVYWIINLVESQIEVYSDPAPEGYRSRQDFKPGQDVPVVIDGREIGRIGVTDIIP